MIHFLKKNIYAIKFIIFCFTKYKLFKFNNISFVIKIYIIKVLFSYPIIRKKFLYSKKIKFKEKNLFFETENSKKIIDQLDNKGISKNIKFKKNQINYIIKELNNSQNLIYKDKRYQNINQIIDYGLKKNISKIIIPINLDNNKKIYDMITSNFFKSVAKGYLNSKKVSINCSLFISLPKKNMQENEKISAAQMFHFDSDFSKFLKLYMYLNDVNKNNGPHIYAERTHNKKIKKHELQKGYSDKQIFKHYKSIKTVVGKKGTIFFEDSFGLHKGETPIKNSRVILNIHYGNGNIKYSKYDKYHIFD